MRQCFEQQQTSTQHGQQILRTCFYVAVLLNDCVSQHGNNDTRKLSPVLEYFYRQAMMVQTLCMPGTSLCDLRICIVTRYHIMTHM